MITTCEKCGDEYDDVYRLRLCPHPEFDMHSVVGRQFDGVYHERVARDVETQRALMDAATADVFEALGEPTASTIAQAAQAENDAHPE